jgi:ubiquinone/menaquinone biosynthesis C-methylase UbiE
MNKLIEQWKKDEQAPFQGWDFSYIKNRYSECEPPWNYIALAKELIKNSSSVLDMGTGGGECFAEILKAYRPEKAVAIEGYEPNVSVARQRLSKFEVEVIFTDETRKVPFDDKSFDLVLNRHSGFNVSELARLIKSGGVFFTQQVDGPDDEKSLAREFGVENKWPENTLKVVVKKLEQNGFEITRGEEWEGPSIFKDVGALIYYLKAIPWIVDNFSVEKYSAVLTKLHQKVETEGQLEFSCKRFLIHAVKK